MAWWLLCTGKTHRFWNTGPERKIKWGTLNDNWIAIPTIDVQAAVREKEDGGKWMNVKIVSKRRAETVRGRLGNNWSRNQKMWHACTVYRLRQSSLWEWDIEEQEKSQIKKGKCIGTGGMKRKKRKNRNTPGSRNLHYQWCAAIKKMKRLGNKRGKKRENDA